MHAKVNSLWELGPLLSFGHLPLKGKTLLWELAVSRDFGQLIISNAKAFPLGEVGGVVCTDIVPECSEWDAIHFGQGVQR
jgi:hypothetical protein